MRQPRSPETSSPAPASCTAPTLSRPIAVETPANLIANVPPNPQQASASACSTSSTSGQRRDQRRARGRVAQPAALVAGAVERHGAPGLHLRLARGRRGARERREQRAELDHALEHALGAGVAGEQLRPGVQHRGGAGAREHHDRALAAGERVERRRGDPLRVLREPGVPGGLAAARLAFRERDLVAGPAQHAHGRHARLRPHEVDQAGRHQGDRPARAHSPRSRRAPHAPGSARTPRSREPAGRRPRVLRRSALRSSSWPGTCAR